MKKIDFKALYTPFVGSVAHSVLAVLAVLLVTVGLIFSAHLLLHTEKADVEEVSSQLSVSEESEAAE